MTKVQKPEITIEKDETFTTVLSSLLGKMNL